MPKVKTHSGTKDRLRVTKNGKVVARRAGRGHFLQKKSSSRKRTYANLKTITGKEARTVKRNLGQ